jgi:hypothetical protein
LERKGVYPYFEKELEWFLLIDGIIYNIDIIHVNLERKGMLSSYLCSYYKGIIYIANGFLKTPLNEEIIYYNNAGMDDI